METVFNLFENMKSKWYKTEERVVMRKPVVVPPLDSFCVKYVNINSNWRNSSFFNFHLDTKAIQKYSQNIDSQLTLLKKKIVQQYNLPSLDQIRYQRKQTIIITILNSMLLKTQTKQIRLMQNGIEYCTQMENFIKIIEENEYPFHVDSNLFLNELKVYVFSSPKIQLLNKKISYLQKAVKNNKATHKEITKKEITNVIEKVTRIYQSYDDFLSDDELENTLIDYINSREDFVSKKQQILNHFSEFDYNIAIQSLTRLSQDVIADLCLEGSSPNQSIIMFTITRYIFSLTAIEMPYILSNNISSIQFQKNCEIICAKTPSELNATKDIFLPKQYNIPIRKLFENSKRLKEGLSYIEVIQFYNSPIDIAYKASKAIDIFTIEIGENIYRNKKCNGDEKAEIPQDVTEAQPLLAFDEIFTVFYMAIALFPPANAPALKVFLNSFSNFGDNQKLEYASTSTQAAISYIMKMQ